MKTVRLMIAAMLFSVAALCLLMISGAASARSTAGIGVGMNESCGSFVLALSRDNPGSYVTDPNGARYASQAYLYMSWVEGFVTATNAFLEEKYQLRSDREGIALALSNYCEANPTDTIFNAVFKLYAQ